MRFSGIRCKKRGHKKRKTAGVMPLFSRSSLYSLSEYHPYIRTCVRKPCLLQGRLFIASTIVVVVLALTHRYNAVRGPWTGSNNSGAKDYLRRKTNEIKTEDNTHKLKQIVYLRQKLYHMLNESQQRTKARRQHSNSKHT